MSPKVIVMLTGAAGAGKDTVAAAVSAYLPGAKTTKIASALWELLEATSPEVRILDVAEPLSAYPREEAKALPLAGGGTVRESLQRLGMLCRRVFGSAMLARNAVDPLLAPDNDDMFLFVTDVRFDEEVSEIQRLATLKQCKCEHWRVTKLDQKLDEEWRKDPTEGGVTGWADVDVLTTEEPFPAVSAAKLAGRLEARYESIGSEATMELARRRTEVAQ